MKVLHLSPSWFGRGSVVGGAERYAWELAKACSARTPTTFVSFGRRGEEYTEDALRVRMIRALPIRNPALSPNPMSPSLMREIAGADVIHCHQADTFPTNAAIVLGRTLGKKVFVSDLGGGHRYAPSTRLPILERATGLLLLSEYSRRQWASAAPGRRPARIDVVYAGVDRARFDVSAPIDRTRVLFVGRLMRHKGVEHAIDAIEGGANLVVAGQPYDKPYAAMLHKRAASRAVTFREHVTDDELPALYASSLVTVLPSVYRTWGGGETAIPELFGLVAAESLAAGTPVIVSNVASLPEVVEHGVTGFVVPPNDPAAIQDAVERLRRDPSLRDEMGRNGRKAVAARFTWDAVADRCMRAYQA